VEIDSINKGYKSLDLVSSGKEVGAGDVGGVGDHPLQEFLGLESLGQGRRVAPSALEHLHARKYTHI